LSCVVVEYDNKQYVLRDAENLLVVVADGKFADADKIFHDE
jgi:hypothetical protein